MASNVFIFELEKKIKLHNEMKYPDDIFVVDYDKKMVNDLWALWNSTCTEKISLNDLRTLDSDGVFLASYRNTFVGFMITDTAGEIGEILAIRVAPQYRGLGIGESLFQKAGYYFTKKKIKTIVMALSESTIMDPAIISLAKRFGFALTTKKKLVLEDRNDINLLKYNYIYHIMKVPCHFCHKSVEFFSALILNRCPKCENPISLDPMAS